jgi:hypothetical protein
MQQQQQWRRSGKRKEGSKQDETQFITINIWSPLGLVGLVPSLDYRSH